MSIPDSVNNTIVEGTHRRKPAAAVLLSLLCGGLGHVYCGRLGKGVALLAITSLIGPMVIAALLLGHTDWTFPTLIISFVAANLIWFYAIIDAFVIARRTPRDYRLKDYNRWYLYLLFILIALPVGTSYALLVREGVCQAFIIPTKSMLPNIRHGDRILVDKRAYRHAPVECGDIVVFYNPNQRQQRWVKRVVALPGDVVEMKQGLLFVNGEELPRVAVADADQNGGKIFEEKQGATAYRILTTTNAPEANPAPQDYPKTTIPPGHCFVLGDNRRQSKDSRQVGPIPLSDIVGRAVTIYFPRWESLK